MKNRTRIARAHKHRSVHVDRILLMVLGGLFCRLRKTPNHADAPIVCNARTTFRYNIKRARSPHPFVSDRVHRYTGTRQPDCLLLLRAAAAVPRVPARARPANNNLSSSTGTLMLHTTVCSIARILHRVSREYLPTRSASRRRSDRAHFHDTPCKQCTTCIRTVRQAGGYYISR